MERVIPSLPELLASSTEITEQGHFVWGVHFMFEFGTLGLVNQEVRLREGDILY